MQKVHIFMRSISKEDWKNHSDDPSILVGYCGYLQFLDSVDIKKEDIWNWCNWRRWWHDEDEPIPRVCRHLKIDHCNSDMAYFYNGKFYSHQDVILMNAQNCWDELKNVTSEYFNALWPTQKNVKLINSFDDVKL